MLSKAKLGLKSLDPFAVFMQKYRIKTFSKDELILVQGETPPCAYVIKKGVVKAYSLSHEGEERPITYDIPKEVFPISWVFDQVRGAPYYYEAFTDTEVYCIPREDYKDFLKADGQRMMAVLEELAGEYLNFQLRINALEQSKASAKILHTLHYLCLRYGVDVRKNLVQIQVPLTHQELANFMGLTRETTGIEIKKLQKSGILTHKRQRYCVRTDRLNVLIDEEYDQNRAVLAQKPIDV